MNLPLLLQFLAMTDELRSREEAIPEFVRLLERYGFDHHVVVRQPKPNEDVRRLLLSERAPREWLDLYIAKKYIAIDPTMRYLGHAQRGFRWREALAAFRSDPHRRRMERMMAEARRHGLLDGYIFPVHGRRGLLGAVSVGGRPVDLSPVEITLFDAIAEKLFWKLLEWSDPVVRDELVSRVEVQLTRREMEALNYLAEGKTSNEISKILEISNHTVDWYMNGIQEKLKARNRHHTVALAFRLGLIS
ncbi:helix-turn-helix transcriptional regulator [Ensifer soli]|uniref:helix-turn-helix transcriptional regulator n=1 Tax=Ciceribacter sp. sgz301302 TaxID=3342379 RepID=UPI0035B90121